MKGLYKGKYLIVYYDEDEIPIIVASSINEFTKKYVEYCNICDPNTARCIVSRVINGKTLYIKNTPRVVLVEADTITDDCFKEADEDFVNFINQTRKKTQSELAKEAGVSVRTCQRRLNNIKKGREKYYDNCR